jgi:hypothetical protein
LKNIFDERSATTKEYCFDLPLPALSREEISNLRVGQVDLVRCTIRLEVGETKNDEGMTPAVYELTRQAMVGKKAEDLLITKPNDRPVGDFRKLWRKLTKQAGLAGIIVRGQ